jgi:hypothetical protein
VLGLWTGTVVGLIAALAAGGCAHAPLFVANKSLRIASPKPMAVVAAPVQVSWQTAELPARATQFLVFVDTPPIHPGQSLRALASGDPSCVPKAGCPNAEYLAARDIFLTSRHSVSIPFVAALSGLEGHDALAIHQLTVILLDARGARVGEYAYTMQFRVRQTTT